MEEMRKNVEAAEHQSFEAEQSLCNALREYVDCFDKDRGRARTLMTKCWQSIQCLDTKNLNIDKDLEDIQSTARRAGWSEEEKAERLCKQLEGDDSSEFQPMMEGIVFPVAEWISVNEIKASQSACMLVPIKRKTKGVWRVPV